MDEMWESDHTMTFIKEWSVYIYTYTHPMGSVFWKTRLT